MTEIAAVLAQPERVVGMHFFNPAPVLPLVEVDPRRAHRGRRVRDGLRVRGADRQGPIACGDTPGFVVNRILIPVLNDAVRVLEEGTASAEDIDKGMRLGTGWPIGPLALIDLIGIDVHVHVCEALWYGVPRPRASRRRRGSCGWCRRGCSAGRAARASTATRADVAATAARRVCHLPRLASPALLPVTSARP